ncbi:MAG: transcriptional repressor [Fusicatenibacter sp.]|nr:transcriptional repressor [Lachnospiraceae bacterium]MDY2937592.1 transcriptional repressor [Fusicatenibacter sp.]
MTKYEKEIFSIINTSTEHLTAEQIFQRLREVHSNVVLATVYNNLNRLLDAELIRRVSIEGMPDRYDRTEKHDHLICRNCGKLADTKFWDLTSSLQEQLGEEFLYYDLKVYYVCPECRKAQQNAKENLTDDESI